MRSGAFEPLMPAYEHADRVGVRARMHGAHRDRAEPAAEGGENRGQARRADGSSETGRPARAARARRRSRLAAHRPRRASREDMRARAGRVGRGAHRARLEERRIGDDEIGLAVDQPRRAQLRGVEQIGLENADALADFVEPRVLARERRRSRGRSRRGPRAPPASASAAQVRPRRRPRRHRRCFAPARPRRRQAAPRRAPTRWPARICRKRNRPPRIASTASSGIAQFGRQTRFAQQTARARALLANRRESGAAESPASPRPRSYDGRRRSN